MVAKMISEYIRPYLEQIHNSPEIMDGLAEFQHTSKQKKEFLNTLVDEAEEALNVLNPYLRPDLRILEVGGGIALLYCFLKSQGYEIKSLEPGSSGYNKRFEAGKKLCDILGVSVDGWLSTRVEELPQKETKKYDLILSFNVLEHIPPLGSAIGAMKQVLATNGMMVHHCPNYRIPFEPHFNIPLVPFFPRQTHHLYRRLKGNELWEGLNFISATKIQIICKQEGLNVRFHKGVTARSLERMFESELFRERKKGLYIIAKTISFLRLVHFIKVLLPATWNTPMTFEVRLR